MYETFLKKIPLFANLPPDDLSALCTMLHEVHLAVGETLFQEGDSADMAYIIYEGELVVTKLVDGREIRLDVQKEAGTVIGESALLEESIRLATIRAVKPSFLLGLGRMQVQELLGISPTAAQIMVKTLTQRSRNIEAYVRHNERMAQLGTMTAGFTGGLLAGGGGLFECGGGNGRGRAGADCSLLADWDPDSKAHLVGGQAYFSPFPTLSAG